MNIGIDIRSTLKKEQTGIGRYTFNLIKALAEIDSRNNYYLYSQKRVFDFKRRLPKIAQQNFRHRVDYFKKGSDKILPELDIFHTSAYDLERPMRAKRFIVTVHGVIIKAYPDGFTEATIKQLDTRLKRILLEADLLIADSYNTKSDLMKFYSVSDSRIQVIYPGVNKPAHLDRPAQLGRLGAVRYILFVGTIEPRKNIQGLIKAFNLLKKEHGIKHKLYIVGMKGWMYNSVFNEYENSEYKDDIIFKGYVKDGELGILYKNASVFVYPSFYEGFGFPVVEAFSYGVPVVTSITSSCGEVAGEAALLIDPGEHKQIGGAILKILDNEDMGKELAQKGLSRANEFSWKLTAERFLKLCRSLA